MSVGLKANVDGTSGTVQVNGNDVVTVNASGQVGVGTSSPSYKVDVAGVIQSKPASGTYGQIILNNQTSGSWKSLLSFHNGATAKWELGVDPANNGTNSLYFWDSAASSTRMLIDSAGNVGIGTTSPGNKLDVVGNISCSNQILLGSGVNNENCVQIGTGRTGNGFAYIDLVGDTTYSDYGTRLIRNNSGANATSTLDHRGTGSLFIKTSDAAQITFTTNSSDRGAVQSDGRWIFGPYNGSTTSGAVTGVEIKNVSGTGDSNVAAMAFHCQAQYATHMYLRADGFFGIGGWSASAWRWYVNMNGGDMTAAGNVTAYSDPRLKEDPVQIGSALDITKALTGVRFKWKENSILGHPGTYDYGVMADEVAAVLPEIVHDSMHDAPEGDKYKTVAYDKLIPVLLEAIKELEARVAELEGR